MSTPYNFPHHVRRIWLSEAAENINVYALFRREFRLDRAESGLTLAIAADTDYIAILDGREIGRGQFSDDPAVKSVDLYALETLPAGAHALTVTVYYNGANFSTYAPGPPGLALRLFHTGFELVSDDQWLGCPHPAFSSGPMPAVSPQLGFTAEFDARRTTCRWTPVMASPLDQDRRDYQERPRGTKAQLGDFLPGRLIRHGRLVRHHQAGSPALQMAADQLFLHRTPATLPYAPDDAKSTRELGIVLIFDLDGEQTGFVEFELDAAEGTCVDFAHGEHLDDGHVRMEVGGRNFADRYICRDGRQSFALPFRRVGARYLELHLTGPAQAACTVWRCGVRPWQLPLPEPAGFTCSDQRLNGLRRRAIRTLELCMHEHYEDCPWREQALYTYDSRSQMLYGYYLWGNYDFAAASLDLWRHGQREDGHLRLCAPSRGKTVIPIYSLIWPVQIHEYWLYSGRLDVFRRNQTALAKLFAKLASVRDSETGLCIPASTDFWHFYEWAPGLCENGCPAGEVHALYNLYMIEALQAYAALNEAAGQPTPECTSLADDLRRRTEALFYDPASGTYASKIRNGQHVGPGHEHTQLMMLHTRSVPQAKMTGVERALRRRTLVPVTLSALPYMIFSLSDRNRPASMRQFAARRMLESYLPMMQEDTDTLWETSVGSADFQFAGSLCHGWSSLPVYYAAAILLGVRPLTPGFARFQVCPQPGRLKQAAGSIPTPAGPIHVAWQRNGQQKYHLQVSCPAALSPEIPDHPDFPIDSLSLQQQ